MFEVLEGGEVNENLHFSGPWDFILELIFYLWTSFGQPFGGLDAHLGPFLAPWRSRVPKLMYFDPPPGIPLGFYFRHILETKTQKTLQKHEKVGVWKRS